MTEAIKPIKIFSLYEASYDFIRAQKDQVQKILFVPFLISSLAAFSMHFSEALAIPSALVSFILSIMMNVAMIRLVLAQETQPLWGSVITWSPRHTTLAIRVILLMLVLGGVLLALAAIVMTLVWALSLPSIAVGVLIALAILGFGYVMLRLSFVMILSVMDQQNVFHLSWKRTAHLIWPLIKILLYSLGLMGIFAMLCGVFILALSSIPLIGVILASIIQGLTDVIDLLLLTLPSLFLYQRLYPNASPQRQSLH